MAKSKSTRRRVRKPKLINVEGHQLTEAMYADYERCLESRGETNSGAPAGTILSLGLADFLAGYRPSHKLKRQLIDLSCRATDICIAFGAMEGYAFYANDVAIRSAGCDLLKKLALELYNASAKLTALASSVETEKETKLQDWLAQAARIEQIGGSGEVANGNR